MQNLQPASSTGELPPAELLLQAEDDDVLQTLEQMGVRPRGEESESKRESLFAMNNFRSCKSRKPLPKQQAIVCESDQLGAFAADSEPEQKQHEHDSKPRGVRAPACSRR